MILMREDMVVINMIKNNYDMRTKTEDDFMDNLKILDKDKHNVEEFAFNFNFPVFSIYDWYLYNATRDKIETIIKYINM